jgi:hypothetical protein
MRDEYTGDEIKCPYCASVGDCSHLLAMIDRTFNECAGGYACKRYGDFGNIIENAFGQLLRGGEQKKSPSNDPDITELWHHALESFSSGDAEVALDSNALDGLIEVLLIEAGAVKYPRPIDDGCGAPGFSSAITLLHAMNPKGVFESALSNLKTRLNLPLPNTPA